MKWILLPWLVACALSFAALIIVLSSDVSSCSNCGHEFYDGEESHIIINGLRITAVCGRCFEKQGGQK